MHNSTLILTFLEEEKATIVKIHSSQKPESRIPFMPHDLVQPITKSTDGKYRCELKLILHIAMPFQHFNETPLEI